MQGLRTFILLTFKLILRVEFRVRWEMKAMVNVNSTLLCKQTDIKDHRFRDFVNPLCKLNEIP